jgi:hypothetical protein
VSRAETTAKSTHGMPSKMGEPLLTPAIEMLPECAEAVNLLDPSDRDALLAAYRLPRSTDL